MLIIQPPNLQFDKSIDQDVVVATKELSETEQLLCALLVNLLE
jgi:hypothetical protein